MQIGMFPITLSHFEHEFLCMMSALTFLENNKNLFFIFIFFGKLWICDKVIWGCMYNLGGVEKKNVTTRRMWILFQPN
jgi:hypothetical protein